MRKIKIIYEEKPFARCRGKLEVIVDGWYFNFGSGKLISGGEIIGTTTKNGIRFEVKEGPWRIEDWPKDFPDEYKEEVLEEINATIPWGCCGGCT